MMTTNTEESYLVLLKDCMSILDPSNSMPDGTSIAVYAPTQMFVTQMELYCYRYAEGWFR